MDVDDDFMAGPVGPKTKTFTSVSGILGKLEGKAAMWERVARDSKERAEDFERAAQAIRDGAASVTVGRTTYVLTDDQ
jgi:C4-type Zn-finger protein